jgi:anti-sigma B factor antagonist
LRNIRPKPTGDLKINVSHNDDVARLTLNGRLTIESSPELRNQILGLLVRQSVRTLTIDLADVPYIDCAGIATLVEALKVAHDRKTTLLLRELRDRPRYLLEVTGLLALFETSDGPAAASASKVL